MGCRRGSDPVLLWLWHRLVATALILPLAWESSYAVGAALKRQKKKKFLSSSAHLLPPTVHVGLDLIPHLCAFQKIPINPNTKWKTHSHQSFSFSGLFRVAPAAHRSSQARVESGLQQAAYTATAMLDP